MSHPVAGASIVVDMAMLLDIKAFLATARAGSFSAAAREIGVAPSVVTKRVGRLEDELGSRLFVRSTRSLAMTAEADRLRPRLQLLVAQLEEVLAGGQPPEHGIAGHLRMKAPTTLGTLFAGRAITRFQAMNPAVTTELMLIDRSVNPLEEGFDIALGALPQSYASVVETPLCPYPRILVATPDYLARHGNPRTPGDLIEHRCIVYVAAGLVWSFESGSGPISVEVNSIFTVNDSRLLHFAARQHLGIAVAPAFLVDEDISRGDLVHVLPDFPVSPLWFKAMVPSNKMHRPEIAAMLSHLQREFEIPPWEREPVPPL
jgi:DNA-binding transcriptional LysR family regulator